MNVIDNLVITLGLDTSGVTKGQKQAQESLKKTGEEAVKTQKELDESAKKTTESYKKVTDGILEFTAVLVGAVAGKEFLQYINKTDSAVGNLSNNIGSTVKQVSTLEGVFRVMGSTTADAEGYLRNTNRILEEIKLKGGSDALNPLAMAGLDVAEFRDARTELERLQLLQNTVRKLTPQDAQARLQAAGYSEATINILLQTRRSLADLYAEQERLNSLSQRDIDMAYERQHAWGVLTEVLEGFGRTTANTVSPAIAGANEQAAKFLGYLKDDGPTAVAVTVGLAGASLKLAGSLGLAGSAASGLVGKLGLYAATAASLYEIVHLLSALGEWGVVKARPGDILNAETRARINSGALNGVGDPFHSGGTGAGIVTGPNPYAKLEAAEQLPPGLMMALQTQENHQRSDGTWPVSPKGAMGPFQFMPRTWGQWGTGDPNNMDDASLAASKYLGHLYRLYGGDVSKTLAGYNEGEGNVAAGYMPAETQKYIRDITGRMNSYGSGGGGGTTITTGPVTITTKSTDPAGIKREFADGLSKFSLASQAQTGVN